MEIVDVDTEATTPTATASATGVQSVPPAAMSSKVHSSGSAFAGGGPGPGIDIYFEASKLPLDVAIFNSTRAAGGDEKIRKYLQAVLVIGGTALMPGMAHALESRLVYRRRTKIYRGTHIEEIDCKPSPHLWCTIWKKFKSSLRQRMWISVCWLGKAQQYLGRWMVYQIYGSPLLIGYVYMFIHPIEYVHKHVSRTFWECAV